MIDSRIPLMGQQQQDSFGNLAQGLQMGQGLRQLLSGRQAGKMAQIDDENERKAFANNSMFSRELNNQLRVDQAQREKALYEQLKAESEINKTNSEAYKNNQQGGGHALDNSGKKQAAIEGVIQQAAMTGDPMQVRLGLHRLKEVGLITPEQYQQETAVIQAMTPEELKQYAQGSALTNKEVAPYLYQTKDNFATNAQSDINNQRTTNASIYSTDVGAETADKNRSQQQQQFDANAYIQQNKPLDYFTAADGTRYAVYANGQGIPITDNQGNSVKVQQGKSETATQKMERQDKVVSFAAIAKNGAEITKMAAEMANDLNGLNSASGGFTPASWAMRHIPGTDAYNFTQKLETLKSNVFLQQVERMRGLGALTDAEGARLEKAVASLNPDVGAVQLQKNIIDVAKMFSEATQLASRRAQIYSGNASKNVTGNNKQQSGGFDYFND